MSELEITPMPEGTGLELAGELDLATAPELAKALFDLQHAGSQITLDLSELTFIDSCGIHAILTLASSVNGSGPVVLLNPTKPVSCVFEMLGLHAHARLDIRSSR